MKFRNDFTATLLFFLFLPSTLNLLAQKCGNLVIVGGGLKPDNTEVYEKFIELAGGAKKCYISIIPTASGCPISSGEAFKNNLIKYGVKPGNINIVQIAAVDCDETPNIDESEWIKNANNSEMAKAIARSTGIWFTGGDQTRIIKALKNDDGSNTLVLNSIYEIWASGAVVGGTSAGAAIMSPVMITGGVSMAALKFGVTDKYIEEEQNDNGPLTLATGLGFFPYGIVDQHFDKRHRLGRLLVATSENSMGLRYGFGIEENTAMVYYFKTNEIEAIGAGGVTIVDITNSAVTKQKYYSFANVDISYIEKNDRYNLATKEFIINPLKRPTKGNEYYAINNTTTSGILSPHSGTFTDLISYRLIDNKVTNSITTYCIDDDNFALKVIFTKTNDTQGFYTNKINGSDSYSFIHVIMNIEPMQITFTPLN